MFGKSFKKYLPAPDKVSQHKMLRWLGPTLTRPSLWQANRRSIALGLAIGVFMGAYYSLGSNSLGSAWRHLMARQFYRLRWQARW